MINLFSTHFFVDTIKIIIFQDRDHEFKINWLKGVMTNISNDEEEIKNTDELLKSHNTSSSTDKSEVYSSLLNYFGYETSFDSEIVPSVAKVVNSNEEENSKSISKLSMMSLENFNRKKNHSKEKMNSQNNLTLTENFNDLRDNRQVNSTSNEKLFLSNLTFEEQINSTDNSKLLSEKSDNSDRQIKYENIFESSLGAFKYKKLVDLININSYLDELMFNYDNIIPEHRILKKVLDDKTFYLTNRLSENEKYLKYLRVN